MCNKNDVAKDFLCLPRISMRTEQMIKGLLGIFTRFVHFEEKAFYLLSIVYVILTYCHDLFEAIPYLQFLGPYGSGKSRVGDFLGKLCFNPLTTGDISDAALFRAIDEKSGPTTVVDEADDLGGRTRRGILLRVLKTGYRQGGSVTRTGRGGRIEKFLTFGPKIILNENGISDRALASRCIKIHMSKCTRPLERLKLSGDSHEFKEAREKVRMFCDDYRDLISDRYASFEGVDGILGRDEEVWGPVIIIADLLAVLLDTSSIKDEIVNLARRMILQREKTQIIGNIPAQILEGARSYVENPPVAPRAVDGLYFHAGENICKYIGTTWSIPNLRLETVSRVLNHYSIIKEVRRLRLKMETNSSQIEVQRSCYALDQEKLSRLSGQYGGGSNL